MSLLAASTSKPNVALQQGPNVISSLGPLVKLAIQFQKLLSSAVFVVFFRTYLAARVIGEHLWLVGHLAALRASFLSKSLALRSTAATKRLLWAAWDSKRARRIRRKVEFEFFVLFLGPGGNALCLMLFWPGWLLLGAIVCAFWSGAS